MLNSVSKLFEKIVAARLMSQLKLSIPNFQFGFLAARSTAHALTKFTTDVSNELSNKRITTAVSLDIQSAFDTVWHKGLIHKLMKIGINSSIIEIIYCFLSQRSFTVGRKCQSSTRKILAGVPQGSVLGPILFTAYLYDLPTCRNIQILQYADDILIYIHHKAPLVSSNLINKYIKNILNFYSMWKLKINVDKTELVNITGSKVISRKLNKNLKTKQNIVINNVKIMPKKELKYLGVIFTSNFKFNTHIDKIIKKVKKNSFIISKIMYNILLEPKFKTFVYKMYIRPIIQYAAMIWLNPSLLTSHQVEKIRIVERKILRKTGNIRRKIGSFKHISNKKLYDINDIVRIDKFLTIGNVNFFHKCSKNMNPIIKDLVVHFDLNNKYFPPSFVFSLDMDDQLLTQDGRLLLYHRGFHDPHSLVYNHDL